MTWTSSEESGVDDEREPLLRKVSKYGLYAAVLVIALGIYALYFSGVYIPTSVAKLLNEIHLAALYAAIAFYIVKSLSPKLRWGSLAAVALLIVSGYVGALVESQELHFLQYQFIPPFVIAEACSAKYVALCDHHGVIAVSVSLIEAFIVVLWALYKIVNKGFARGS